MNREIQYVLERTMTVRHLREALEDCDPDAHVLLACNYGDYHHTQQALPISDTIECESDTLAESAYSQSGIAFIPEDGEPDEPREEDDDATPIVILNSD